ncbi:uncharacterized protein LOC117652759 isoform X1 [Thrips palmi]|uniref:Uncharacterized protein LOC117652759 isoform X1 n=1 Tax=Thrips palmi TaxID=161013 RepID=A0A6P9AD25_THRPL|nr:uncharacterized protein LOC117652759 isoform X1 [Thrips palmi]
MGRISITGADATCDLLLVVLSDTLAQNLRAFVARLREAVEQVGFHPWLLSSAESSSTPLAGCGFPLQKAAPAFWEDARLTYGKLVDLIAIFDAKMGPFVILSFFQNGAYFCNTLTYILGFRPTNSSGNSTNLIFVAVRLFFVSLFTTNVHQEWLGLKLVLSNVPTESYSNAVLRFHSQVCSENVALTGLGVFSLTRQFLLSVVGFLTTFETILVQLGRH